jgi:hypothetical protein
MVFDSLCAPQQGIMIEGESLEELRVPDKEFIRKLFDEALYTHIVAYSAHAWDDDSKPSFPLPVKAFPIEPLVEAAIAFNMLGNTRLEPGAHLYRGFGGIDPASIHGYDGASGKLTLDRITSFTPFEDVARGEFGPTTLCIKLPSKSVVFCDDTMCASKSTCFCDHKTPCNVTPGKLHHGGDLGTEVQLLPGTYKIVRLYM